MLIDLSHPLAHGQASFPNDPPLAVRVWGTIPTFGYNISEISMSSHQGTHLDAPYHFFDGAPTIDQIPLDRFYGPARRIDLAPGGALPPHTPLTVEMFAPHEAVFEPGAKVLYRTGWDRMFDSAVFFSDYPTLTLEAARWIAAHRVSLLGMDTPTPSVNWLECHHILLGPESRIVVVEGLAHLERLPSQFTFCGFPLNIQGRDGAPIRAVAIVDDAAASA